jgi:hypothetical protein
MEGSMLQKSFYIALLVVVASAANAFELRSMQSKKCLDVERAVMRNETPISQFDCSNGGKFWQQIIVDRNDSPPNTVTLKVPINAAGTRFKCIDARGGGWMPNGTPIILFTCNNRTNQQWYQEPWPVAGPYVYRFRNYHNSGKQCLDIRDASMNNGARAIIWTCHSGANQLFQRNPIPTN